MSMIEAECERCGGIFVPQDEDDLIHLWDEEKGEECGGQGKILGVYDALNWTGSMGNTPAVGLQYHSNSCLD